MYGGYLRIWGLVEAWCVWRYTASPLAALAAVTTESPLCCATWFGATCERGACSLLLDNPACLQRPKKEPPALLKLQGAKAPAVGSLRLGSLNSQKQYMLFTHGNVEHHETGFTPQTYVTKAVAKVLRHS